MTVHAITESERERPPLRLHATDEPAPREEPQNKPKPQRPIRQVIFPAEQTMIVLGALSRVIASRVILMMAGAGAFALSALAVYMGTVPALISSGLYDLFVFGPCIYLAMRRE